VTAVADVADVARRWRDEDPDPTTRAEVDALLAAGDDAGLADRFGRRLAFGTAGLRGAMGAGPNRMNVATVRYAAAGLGRWLLEREPSPSVVIGFDARHRSADFAVATAGVLTAAGVRARLLPRALPTPVLAFAVGHLGASAGVMVTASHNPAADNGYKVYASDGAQIVPPADVEIAAAIASFASLADVPVADDGWEQLGDEVLAAYLSAAAATLPPGPRDVRATYTPLHGVGGGVFVALAERVGFPAVHVVAEQAEPDPNFPTVAFPNPEEPGALDLSLALARDVDAQLVLANDPDADRLAVALPDPAVEGGWRPLTGDELGAVLADHLLRRGGHTPEDTLVTTVVSSRLLSKLAAAGGVGYAEALTGFKWVVRAPGPGRRFLFGYEEALGYCAGDLVRDKDGISTALLVAELAAQGPILDRLHAIFREHGAHVTRQRSVRIQGSDWLDRVTAAMAAVRATPPGQVAGRAVLEVEDLAPGGRLPPSDVLIWTLDGARAVVRPSGTEPKLKIYAEAVAAVTGDDVEAARRQARAVVDEVLDSVAAVMATHGL
jgi:phosphomannomutase